MKTEQLNVPSFHRESLKDDRLFIETRDRVLGYCPRNCVSANYNAQEEKLQLRHPVSVLEFLCEDCKYLGLRPADQTAIYLAAKTVHAELAGLDEDANKYREQFKRLIEAKKAAGEVIADSGIERELHEYESAQPIPF